MPLGTYVGRSRQLIQELIDSASESDIASVRNWLESESEAGWMEWRIQNHRSICEFAAASPSQRGRRKLWNQPDTAPLYCLAALQVLIGGWHLLETVDQAEISPGPSYRDMTVMAGTAYFQLFLKCDPYQWPFGEPAPFDWKAFS